MFVIRTLIVNRHQVVEAISGAHPALSPWLRFCLPPVESPETGIGLARAALRLLGADLGLAVSLRGYFVGQLGKVCSWGVWAIMGRGEWGRGMQAYLALSPIAASSCQSEPNVSSGFSAGISHSYPCQVPLLHLRTTDLSRCWPYCLSDSSLFIHGC